MRYQLMRFPDGKAKAFTLSYDDAPEADRRFIETINKYGLKCTFNLNSQINQNFSVDEIKKNVLENNHEIAVHGELHRALGKVRPIEGIKEVLNCRLDLEERFDIIIRGMAYPDSGITKMLPGVSYEQIREYLKNLDIAYARTLGADNDNFNIPEDFYAWVPTAHHKNPNLMQYIEKFTNPDFPIKDYSASRDSRLFYLWGHSYEFDRENNWDLLENICEKISRKDDIWYATNMEICEYVNAYNSLIYSANGKKIYNPTLKKIWFDIDEKLYSIESGKTITIE